MFVEPQRPGHAKDQQRQAHAGTKHPQPPALRRWRAAGSVAELRLCDCVELILETVLWLLEADDQPLLLPQELHALGEFLMVKRLQLLWVWQVAVEDDLIIEAEGTTERIGHRPSVET